MTATTESVQAENQLAAAIYALRRCGFRCGAYVFVTGTGELGVLAAAAAKEFGAAGVAMGCTSEEAGFVKSLGYEPYIYGQSDHARLVQGVTEGRGFDFALETSGTEKGYEALLKLTKRGAVVALLTKLEQPYTFFVKTAVRSQIRFVGVRRFDERSAQMAKTLLKNEKLNTVLAAI